MSGEGSDAPAALPIPAAAIPEPPGQPTAPLPLALPRASSPAALLRQLTDQVLREQELRRLLAYAAYSGHGLKVTEVASVAQAAEPEKGDSMAMTLVQKLRAEGREDGLIEGLTKGRIEGLLEARFGDAGLALLPEIRRITDIVRLQCVLEAARHGKGLDDVQLAIQG